MTESRRRERTGEISGPADANSEENRRPVQSQSGVPVGIDGPGITDSVPATEAEADAGTDAIWDTYDQTLAAAVRERDRALDKATARLASVTAGGYLEYDHSVSIALAAFESAWHNARMAHAAVPR